MQGQQQQGPGDLFTIRNNFNLLGFIAICHATCFTPILLSLT